MKFFVCCLLLLSTGVKAQFANLKTRNLAQDSALEMVFQKYLKANDSIADLRHLEMIHNFSDSADKYTNIAATCLRTKNMDSCIFMIHVANMYINNTQVLLHLKPSDKWQQRPTY